MADGALKDLPNSKLDELAERSANKNSGVSANYIIANQALRGDLFSMITMKFSNMEKQITNLQKEVKKSRERETKLEMMVADLKKNQVKSCDPPNKQDLFLVGSSVLREVRADDITNGTVQSISGGKIANVKEEISSLKFKPKQIITQVGGNDLDSQGASVEKVASDYEFTLTESKVKFPEAEIIVAGLPPRHHSVEIRTKVKDYNDRMKRWCNTNDVKYIDNEDLFEYRSGDVDNTSYVMTGATPALHLTRSATVRMLENMAKSIPEMVLSENRHKTMNYAKAAATRPRDRPPHGHQQRNQQTYQRHTPRQNLQMRCWNCGITGHNQETCKHEGPVRCHGCGRHGHKIRYCGEQGQ
jgi:lysophospholipase L1-like esterase